LPPRMHTILSAAVPDGTTGVAWLTKGTVASTGLADAVPAILALSAILAFPDDWSEFGSEVKFWFVGRAIG
jgi:hypothetical protein